MGASEQPEREFEAASASELSTHSAVTQSVVEQSFWQAFIQKIEVEGHDPTRKSNPDLDPVPPEARVWNWWNYVSYWISDNFSPTGWRKAASMISLGMSWRLALLNIAIAEIICGIVITVNGFIGAKYNISFTIQSRASFGYYLSYGMVFMRMVVGMFWYGVSTYAGAECVRTMIYAIWPSFRNVANQLPTSAGINTQLMTAYVIYFASVLPLHYVGVGRLRFLFTVKAITTPLIGFGIMGWTIKNASIGSQSLWNEGNTKHGSELGWVFMTGVFSNISGWATLAVNSPDFTRYAISPKHTYAMAIALPATATLIAFFGVVCAAGSTVLFGELLWDPLVFVDNWTSKGGRAAAFFCGLGFYLAQACTNISANSISAANDLNCMFPRFVNVRRGQYIVAFIGAWAFVPWNILTSTTSFLSFMNGYAIWLAPMCGVMVADFYCVHHRRYHTFELYNKDGIYRYNRLGVNWNAAAAFTIGWVPLLPGFMTSVNANIVVGAGADHLFSLGYFYGFGAAFATYWALESIFKHEATQLVHAVYPDDENYVMPNYHEELIEFYNASGLKDFEVLQHV
ncbi:permease for cytosine/purines, uracil, thiamine, allantoin-domain-containing protein [Limtongia smithiae]|uniref:permease for cytosine/purines, uracil, thiamine, allantoin-domain-containing protein n=1 Tax=Limtongia smithiae TaxID=1125753 RepID=UPI0034CEB64B